MKLFFSLIFLGAATGVYAQNSAGKTSAPKDSINKPVTGGYMLPANTKYLLPDGKIVDGATFDSVSKSWGGMFSMSHNLEHPGIISVFPVTTADARKSADEKAQQGTLLNTPAPEFNLKDVDGKYHDLKSLKGKVVVLNFWFIGCAPCQAEMPELNAIRSRADLSKAVFLSLGLDNAAAIRKFLKTHRFEYTPLTYARAIHQAYKVASCPTSIVIDKNGIIRFIQVSGLDIGATLPTAIKAVL
jgi:peroxiredoxin